MGKKIYRIDIPNEFKGIIIEELAVLDKAVLQDSGVWNQYESMFYNSFYIPGAWLTEIKEKLSTNEELQEQIYRRGFDEGYRACEWIYKK